MTSQDSDGVSDSYQDYDFSAGLGSAVETHPATGPRPEGEDAKPFTSDAGGGEGGGEEGDVTAEQPQPSGDGSSDLPPMHVTTGPMVRERTVSGDLVPFEENSDSGSDAGNTTPADPASSTPPPQADDATPSVPPTPETEDGASDAGSQSSSTPHVRCEDVRPGQRLRVIRTGELCEVTGTGRGRVGVRLLSGGERGKARGFLPQRLTAELGGAESDGSSDEYDESDPDSPEALRKRFPTGSGVTVNATGERATVVGISRGRIGVETSEGMQGLLPSMLTPLQERKRSFLVGDAVEVDGREGRVAMVREESEIVGVVFESETQQIEPVPVQEVVLRDQQGAEVAASLDELTKQRASPEPSSEGGSAASSQGEDPETERTIPQGMPADSRTEGDAEDTASEKPTESEKAEQEKPDTEKDDASTAKETAASADGGEGEEKEVGGGADVPSSRVSSPAPESSRASQSDAEEGVVVEEEGDGGGAVGETEEVAAGQQVLLPQQDIPQQAESSPRYLDDESRPSTASSYHTDDEEVPVVTHYTAEKEEEEKPDPEPEPEVEAEAEEDASVSHATSPAEEAASIPAEAEEEQGAKEAMAEPVETPEPQAAEGSPSPSPAADESASSAASESGAEEDAAAAAPPAEQQERPASAVSAASSVSRASSSSSVSASGPSATPPPQEEERQEEAVPQSRVSTPSSAYSSSYHTRSSTPSPARQAEVAEAETPQESRSRSSSVSSSASSGSGGTGAGKAKTAPVPRSPGTPEDIGGELPAVAAAAAALPAVEHAAPVLRRSDSQPDSNMRRKSSAAGGPQAARAKRPESNPEGAVKKRNKQPSPRAAAKPQKRQPFEAKAKKNNAWSTPQEGAQQQQLTRQQLIENLRSKNTELQDKVDLVRTQLEDLLRRRGQLKADRAARKTQEQRMKLLEEEYRTLVYQNELLEKRYREAAKEEKVESRMRKAEGQKVKLSEANKRLMGEQRENEKRLKLFSDPDKIRREHIRNFKDEMRVLRIQVERLEKVQQQSRGHAEFHTKRLAQLQREDKYPDVTLHDIKRGNELTRELQELTEEQENLEYRLNVLRKQKASAERVAEVQRASDERDEIISLKREVREMKAALGIDAKSPRGTPMKRRRSSAAMGALSAARSQMPPPDISPAKSAATSGAATPSKATVPVSRAAAPQQQQDDSPEASAPPVSPPARPAQAAAAAAAAAPEEAPEAEAEAAPEEVGPVAPSENTPSPPGTQPSAPQDGVPAAGGSDAGAAESDSDYEDDFEMQSGRADSVPAQSPNPAVAGAPKASADEEEPAVQEEPAPEVFDFGLPPLKPLVAHPLPTRHGSGDAVQDKPEAAPAVAPAAASGPSPDAPSQRPPSSGNSSPYAGGRGRTPPYSGASKPKEIAPAKNPEMPSWLDEEEIREETHLRGAGGGSQPKSASGSGTPSPTGAGPGSDVPSWLRNSGDDNLKPLKVVNASPAAPGPAAAAADAAPVQTEKDVPLWMRDTPTSEPAAGPAARTGLPGGAAAGGPFGDSGAPTRRRSLLPADSAAPLSGGIGSAAPAGPTAVRDKPSWLDDDTPPARGAAPAGPLASQPAEGDVPAAGAGRRRASAADPKSDLPLWLQ